MVSLEECHDRGLPNLMSPDSYLEARHINRPTALCILSMLGERLPLDLDVGSSSINVVGNGLQRCSCAFKVFSKIRTTA